MGKLQLEGVFTAIVTPFNKDGTEVDYEALDKLLTNNIDGGVSGVVPIGTTGESPALTTAEKEAVIKFCVDKCKGKCKVIAGTGSNVTSVAVESTKRAKELGVDCALIVNPYYNKPGQEGQYQHVVEIGKVGLPIMLYNIPGRCGITMSPETVARLYNDVPEVCAIKEATGSLDIASEIRSLCDITVLSGDDSLTIPLMSIGGKGVVSVLSNLAPEKVVSMVNAGLKGDFSSASKQHVELFKVFKNMFIESNPAPAKYAMEMAGICNASVRLPMTQMSEENAQILANVLVDKGILDATQTKKRRKLN